MSTQEPKSPSRMRRWAGRVADPAALPHVIVTSAAAGALSLIDPARRGVGGRLLLRSGSAVVTGFVSWCDVRRSQPLATAIGVTAASVGASLALSEAGEAIDARLHRFVVRRGARRPRLVLAVLGTLLMLLAHLISRRVDEASALHDDDDDWLIDDDPVEIPAPVREIVSALLARSDEYGAAELRAQLDAAQAMEYLGDDETVFFPEIGFAVPDDLRRAVPSEARFPVVGRYHPFDGRSADVFLSISNGRLASLSITTGDDWDIDEKIAWMESDDSLQQLPGWPALDELSFLIETPEGLKPLD